MIRPEEPAATDPVFLKELGLLAALSTNRGNGIAAMARKIRELAALQRGMSATVKLPCRHGASPCGRVS